MLAVAWAHHVLSCHKKTPRCSPGPRLAFPSSLVFSQLSPWPHVVFLVSSAAVSSKTLETALLHALMERHLVIIVPQSALCTCRFT